MELIQILIAIIALAILAEVTFLVVKLPRQNNISKKQGRPILVDTSVLIDGRIIAVAQSGFIGDTLVIPRSVIGELQFLADNADHDKRARARYGLDVVKELQVMKEVDVEILQDGSKAEEGVDERLLNLAKKHNASVCTIDYNLNKVAVVEGIAVLNVNELAKSLRMAYLPGEKMMLELVQKGQDSHQGVGYLPDGTMVVVEHAYKSIGKAVEIEFIRSLQTAAGKMMFAKPTTPEEDAKPTKQARPTGKKPVEKEKVIAKAERPAQKTQRNNRASEKKQENKPTKPATLAPATPMVYHSDDHEQRRANKPQQNSRVRANSPKAQKTAPVAPQNSQQAYAQKQAKQASKRPKTSSQREAALIDLVQNQ